jgi:membrane protein implicated in regulation of membrane protease activity
MEQEQGCGWGCGLILLGVLVGLMALFPFTFPLGMVIAIGGVLAFAATRSRKRDSEPQDAEEEASEQEPARESGE